MNEIFHFGFVIRSYSSSFPHFNLIRFPPVTLVLSCIQGLGVSIHLRALGSYLRNEKGVEPPPPYFHQAWDCAEQLRKAPWVTSKKIYLATDTEDAKVGVRRSLKCCSACMSCCDVVGRCTASVWVGYCHARYSCAQQWESPGRVCGHGRCLEGSEDDWHVR